MKTTTKKERTIPIGFSDIESVAVPRDDRSRSTLIMHNIIRNVATQGLGEFHEEVAINHLFSAFYGERPVALTGCPEAYGYLIEAFNETSRTRRAR